jgi:hypothetical protein
VDDPCSAAKVVSHCVAHVYVVNHGGEGFGHATIAVPLRDASAPASSARTGTPARCPKYIPDTPGGGVVDLTCNFDLPVGQTVASVPVLQGLDFQGTLGSSPSSGDSAGIATFALALIAAALAVIALAITLVGRRPSFASFARQGSDARATPGQDAAADEEDDSSW